jgi:hypothetical protein
MIFFLIFASWVKFWMLGYWTIGSLLYVCYFNICKYVMEL